MSTPTEPEVDPEVTAFEARCREASIKPTSVCERAGVSQSTWFRWKAGDSSPTFRSFRALENALEQMLAEQAARAAA